MIRGWPVVFIRPLDWEADPSVITDPARSHRGDGCPFCQPQLRLKPKEDPGGGRRRYPSPPGEKQAASRGYRVVRKRGGRSPMKKALPAPARAK